MRNFVCLMIGIALLFFSSGLALAQPEIHINIPSYTLQLTEDDKVLKEYDIAVGTPFEQTPVGSFAIFFKEKNPTWFPGENFNDRSPVPPGPDNPLGTRWMEYKTHYGIHGTNKGWDISFPVSGGCIRMHDKDAQDLYERVSIGTPVIITYETLFLLEKPDGLYVRIFPDIYNRHTTTPERLQKLYESYASNYTAFHNPLPLPAELDTMWETKIAVPLQKSK